MSGLIVERSRGRHRHSFDGEVGCLRRQRVQRQQSTCQIFQNGFHGMAPSIFEFASSCKVAIPSRSPALVDAAQARRTLRRSFAGSFAPPRRREGEPTLSECIQRLAKGKSEILTYRFRASCHLRNAKDFSLVHCTNKQRCICNCLCAHPPCMSPHVLNARSRRHLIFVAGMGECVFG